MVCGDCVKKLAAKLRQHFNLSEEQAYRRAKKGIERVEKRQERDRVDWRKSVRKAVAIIKGKPHIIYVPLKHPHNPDYYQNCLKVIGGENISCGFCECIVSTKPFLRCAILTACSAETTCDCPDPLEGSELVETNCTCRCRCPDFTGDACPEGVTCECNDNCGYNWLADGEELFDGLYFIDG